MFKDDLLNTELIQLIENQQYDEAVDFIIKNKEHQKPEGQCHTWLFWNYNLSNFPQNWENFFSRNHLYSNYNFITTSLFKSQKSIYRLWTKAYTEGYGEYIGNFLVEFLSKNISIECIPDIASALSQAPQEEQVKWLAHWAQVALKSNYPYVIFKLSQFNNFKLIADQLTREEKQKLELFLDKKKAQFFNKKMISMQVGEIDYETCLTVLAHIGKKKPYNFNCTVLKKNKDFYQFMKLLIEHKNKAPFREKFIFSSIHWFSGEIEIKKDGQINVLINDSLGDDAYPFNGVLNTLHSKCRQLFPSENITIYLNADRRQYALSGCSVYAIDDTVHLYGIERVINQNIFNYLSDHLINETKGKPTIKKCEFPLSFLRTTQSSLKIQEINKRSEKESYPKVNKKGDTIIDFSFFFKENPEKNKLQNRRIDIKLGQLKNEVALFLMDKNPEEVEKLSENYTLDSFRARFAKT